MAAVGRIAVSAFARATAVEPLGGGAWRATSDAAWATQLGANGGYLAALVLRAMAAELDDPARAARSLTCHYLRPPAEGDVHASALAMYADAWWPSPLPRLTRPVTAPTIDLTVHFRAPAAAAAIVDEPVLAIFRSSTAAHGFFEEDGELWSRDGVLLAHSRQLALIVDGGR
jgi:hypothetical protein